MSRGFTFYNDMSSVSLTDSDPVWVHALPLGEYQHPIHGTLSFTAERIKRFAASVKNRVLGIDPDIDYDHKADPVHGKKAAGWVKDAEARSNGLWLLVEWTKAARESIKNKEYRYFSAEYVDEMEDNQGNKFTDVVRGGGLTNRPFMKNLVPINLSELGMEETPKENEMNREELIKLLGLSEDATDEQIKEAISAKASEKFDFTKAEITVGDDGVVKVSHPDVEDVVEHKLEVKEPKTTTEDITQGAIDELAKSNPAAAAALSETLEANKKLSDDVKSLVATQRLSDIGVSLSEVGADKKRTLSPVVQSKLSAALVRLPKELSDEIIEVVSEMVSDNGIVQLGEVTPSSSPSGGGKGGYNPVKKFTEAVDGVRKENDKLSYSEAVSLAASENPELFEDYRSAVADGVTLSD